MTDLGLIGLIICWNEAAGKKVASFFLHVALVVRK